MSDSGDLTDALLRDSNRLTFVFQPIVATATGLPARFEMLARWDAPHPNDSLQPWFTGAVRDSGLSDIFTELTLAAASEAIPELRRLYGPTAGIAVNLSDHQVTTSSLDLIDATLAASSESNWLSVEILEDLDWERIDEIATIVEQLRRRSIPVYLDDFGTGTTSLELLTVVGFDGVKIDARIISKLRTSQLAQRVVGGYVTACHQVGIETVAEGVQDAELADGARLLTFTQMQGYHLGRPVEISALVPSPRAAPCPGDSHRSNRLDDLAIEVEAFDDNNLGPSLEHRLSLLDDLEARLERSTDGATADGLRAWLLRHRAGLATHASRPEIAVEMGTRAAELAERCGMTGVQITALLLVAANSPDNAEHGVHSGNVHSGKVDSGSVDSGSAASGNAHAGDAIARAMQLYRNEPLAPETRIQVNNSFAVMFAELGLFDEALAWWERSLRDTVSRPSLTSTRIAANLIELLVGAIEGDYAEWASLTTSHAALADEALDSLASNAGFVAPTLQTALRCRYLLAAGRTDEAQAIAGELPEMIPPGRLFEEHAVLRARAMISRQFGDDQQFLDNALSHLNFLSDRAASYRIFNMRALRLLAEAWERNDRFDEANQTLRRLLGSQRSFDSRSARARRAWVEAHLDSSRVFRSP